MAPEVDPRIRRAFSAMNNLGIKKEAVKPVLKRLLKLYNKQWELIEEDNYRTLADAIFEYAEDKDKDEQDADMITDKVEPPRKKQHRELHNDQACTVENGRRIEYLEEDEVPNSSIAKRLVDSSQSFPGDPRREPHCSVRQASSSGNKLKDSIWANSASDEENSSTQPASGALFANREPNDPGLSTMMRETAFNYENGNAIVSRRKQHIDQSPEFPIPTSGICPGLTKNASQHLDTRVERDGSNSASNLLNSSQITYDLAASTCGQVKVSLTCNLAQQQCNFHTPRADDFLRFVERKYRDFHKTFGTNSSFIKLLNELCDGYLVMEADSNDISRTKELPENYVHSLRPNRDSIATDHTQLDLGKRVSNGSGSSLSRDLVIALPQPVNRCDRRRSFHKVDDITKLTEKVQISLIDEMGNEVLPKYTYIPQNIPYESAYVHVSLARVADEDCCSGCIEDCLSSSIPCACARDTGGEFAYTPEGLLNEKFLRSCISMKVAPQSQHLFYCQDCPLERAKNASRPEKCKGHMLRKFIKECWRKCGCNMLCGNRVVQRGITRKLQVFSTSEGKGWGLQTLEELPEGAFVCEYVGEILTNMELYERNKKSNGEERHTYPVLLDADWATEGVLKDEDALCLDATHYGNVARFINHRCFDANLLEIPVQVETPDRHYYRLAFFTKRKVAALEELTWDYEIDFDDDEHPVKAFQCRCGSEYCRDRKRKGQKSEAGR